MQLQNIKDTVSNLFPNLKEDDIDVFLSITKFQSFNNKELILNAKRNDKLVFLILKGSARAWSIKNEIELNDHLRSDGIVFADPRVLGEEPLILNIEAIGETHGLLFDIETLEKLGFQHPGLMKFYLGILKEAILTLSRRVHSFVSMSSEERYEDLIKWNPLYFKSTYDKQIATFLGITPLTLHRIKKKLLIK